MEYGGGAALVQNNNSSNSSAAAFGSMAESASGEVGDLIDELLVEGCWVETTAGGGGCYNMMHPSSCDDLAQAQGQYYMAATSNNYNNNTSCDDDEIIMMLQQESEESFVVGKRWWIGPRGIPGGGGPTSSVKERLVVAVGYLIKEYYYTTKTNNNNNNNNNVLIQVWVPPRCRSSALVAGLHYHRLSMDHDHEAVAFPNTNTNPNNNNNYYVRFLRSYPPRLHQYDAPRGSLALPLLERGTGACLGVLDILIPNNNYHPHLLPLDNALQAVDYRSCHQNFIIPPAGVKVFEELYQAAVNEIVEVMTSVCKTQNLPLALTWAPCVQQEGKCGGGCVSTVDSAWFVGDLQMLGFQEACSECHLLRGQGIVGTALTTAKPCFAMDITAFSKAEYPLSHHATLFGLHAAVAIPFRSVYTGSAADFVLEFFLPKECRDSADQKHLLNSLSILVQQACRTLHVATATATDHHLLLDDEADFTLPPPTPAADNHKLQQLFAEEEEEAAAKESSSSITATSWIAHMMEAQGQGQQNKGKGVCVYQLEDPKEEFKVTTNWDAATSQSTHHLHFTSSDFGHIDHTSASASLGSASADGGLDQQDSYAAAAAAFGGRRSSSATSGGGRKSGDKRRTKAEKTISLPVLRQYFAGSLKDAAKSIGVCPTTLKRICRQHGITRWPSRKIKKVGHSLKKLQLVIDSVQGAEGAIQIGSFYASFPELGSADFSSSSSPTTTARSSQPSKKAPPNSLKSAAAAASASCTSQTTAAFGAANHHHHHHHHHHHDQQANNPTAVMMTMTESCDAAAAAELQQQQHASSSMLIQEGEGEEGEEEEDTKKHFAWRGHGAFRVKATFVDEKIRFSLQPNWGFRDLQVEIARRFNLNDISSMDLKYLDDDGEWVLLACDADLHECKDIHTSSQTRTIRLSLFPSTCPPS